MRLPSLSEPSTRKAWRASISEKSSSEQSCQVSEESPPSLEPEDGGSKGERRDCASMPRSDASTTTEKSRCCESPILSSSIAHSNTPRSLRLLIAMTWRLPLDYYTWQLLSRLDPSGRNDAAKIADSIFLPCAKSCCTIVQDRSRSRSRSISRSRWEREAAKEWCNGKMKGSCMREMPRWESERRKRKDGHSEGKREREGESFFSLWRDQTNEFWAISSILHDFDQLKLVYLHENHAIDHAADCRHVAW